MRTTQIPIFAIYEAAVFPKTTKLSIFGQQKHFIMEIEPCDSLTIFLRFWPFGLHFLIIFSHNNKTCTKCIEGLAGGQISRRKCRKQAHSQTCVSGVAKLSQMNHVVQNLGAYFVFYVIKIKWIICVLEKIEFSCMSQRVRWSST